MSVDARRRLARALPALEPLVLVLGAEAGLALAYLAATDAGLAAPATLLVPFVWVTAAVFGVRAVQPVGSRRVRIIAGVLGVAYGVALAWFAGLVGLASGPARGVSVVFLPPGWGPLVRYTGDLVALTVFPYKALGYAALAYVVYAVATHAFTTGRALAGAGSVLAVFSCVGCAFPLLAAVGGAGVGTAAAVFGPATPLVGTLAYVVAVLVLARGPGLGRACRR